MDRCKTCTHWRSDTENQKDRESFAEAWVADASAEDWGVCRMAWCDPATASLSYAIDNDGNSADLFTHQTYGCPQHEEK